MIYIAWIGHPLAYYQKKIAVPDSVKLSGFLCKNQFSIFESYLIIRLIRKIKDGSGFKHIPLFIQF